MPVPNLFYPAEMTKVNEKQFAAAAGFAWQKATGSKLSDAGIYLLTAHWGLETGWGQQMFNYNCGNVKAGEKSKWEGGVCYYQAGENFSKTIWVDFYPRTFPGQGCVNRFRAFATLIDGVTNFVGVEKGYAQVLNSGDPAAFSHALKVNRYYTAGEEGYTKGLVSCFGIARSRIGKVPAPEALEVRKLEPAGSDPLQDPKNPLQPLAYNAKPYWPFPPKGDKPGGPNGPCCAHCKGVFAFHNGFRDGMEQGEALLKGWKDDNAKEPEKAPEDKPPAGGDAGGKPAASGGADGKSAGGDAGGKPAASGGDPGGGKAAGGGADGKSAGGAAGGPAAGGAGAGGKDSAADSLIVEGDFAKVKIELAAGDTGAKPARPGPGTQLVWGGSDASSPFGHLLALIEKGGGSVSYTQIHASMLIDHAAELPRPSGAPGAAPATPATPANVEPAAPPAGKPAGDKPQVEVKPPSTPAQSAGEDHHSGAAGKGPLFEYGVTFAYQGEEAKVWAHPRAANAGPRPLVVYLHGINASGYKHSSLDELAGKTTKGTPAWVHVGKLAQKLIDDGLVTPMIMAAPTNGSDAPWGKFDLPSFVNMVEQKCRDQGVEIDLDQVSLAAHSGGGGYPGRGLNKIAAEGGAFSGHKLRVFGVQDTRIYAPMAKDYVENLKKAGNETTTIYSVHRNTGGWSTPEYNAGGGSEGWAKALTATTKNTSSVVATEVMDDCVDYYNNGDTKPTRVSIKINMKSLPKYHAVWQTAGGYFGDVGSHSDMVPMWTWWSLPRFYPQTEADKKLMAAHAAAQADAPPPEAKPTPKPPAGPPAVTGGEFNIPPAPPVWTNPAGDIAPKAHPLAPFADATAAVYWPVRIEKHPWKRGVHYMGEDNKLYDINGKHAGGCHFLADRSNGKRYHVGIDLNFGAYKAIIVACEAGKIVNFYPFLVNASGKGVSCLIVEHDSGITINYGEVDHGSMNEFKLKKGDRVQAGQPIARMGQCPEGDSMLHFETYPAAAVQAAGGHNIPYSKSSGEKFLSHFYDPTSYLMYLAKNGR